MSNPLIPSDTKIASNATTGTLVALPMNYVDLFSMLLLDERLESAEKWVFTAVTENARGAEPDIDILKNHYLKTDDFQLLRLFGTRFIERLNTAEELAVSTHTAVSLARFIVDERGADALFGYTSEADKSLWLSSIGVERDYIDPFNGYLDVFSVTCNDPLTITCSEAIYTLETYSFAEPSLGFDTAERIERFLYREAHGKEYINNWLRENVVENISLVLPPRNRITYENNSNISMSTGNFRTLRITLKHTADHLHEYIHIILTRHGQTWQNEGISEYLSQFVYPDSYFREVCENHLDEGGRFVSMFFSSQYWDSYETIIYDHYLRFIAEDEVSYPLNIRALYDAVSAALLTDVDGSLRENGILKVKPISQIYPRADRSNPGNELSYIEAASFVAYLVDTYSFETTTRLLIVTDPDISSIFGKDYYELRSEWIDSLTQP